MAMSREQYIQAFTEIQRVALSTENPYALNEDCQHNLRVALNTMLYLLRHLDEPALLNGMGFYEPQEEKTSPIHLDNHPNGNKRETSFNETIFGPFITYFNDLKSKGNEYVQTFCTDMRGYCIEERTRKPYSYGQSILLGMSMEDIVREEEALERAQPTLLEQMNLQQAKELNNQALKENKQAKNTKPGNDKKHETGNDLQIRFIPITPPAPPAYSSRNPQIFFQPVVADRDKKDKDNAYTLNQLWYGPYEGQPLMTNKKQSGKKIEDKDSTNCCDCRIM